MKNVQGIVVWGYHFVKVRDSDGIRKYRSYFGFHDIGFPNKEQFRKYVEKLSFCKKVLNISYIRNRIEFEVYVNE